MINNVSQWKGERFSRYLDGKINPLVSDTYPLAEYEKAFQCLAKRRALNRLSALQCFRGQLTEQVFVALAELPEMPKPVFIGDLLDQ